MVRWRARDVSRRPLLQRSGRARDRKARRPVPYVPSRQSQKRRFHRPGLVRRDIGVARQSGLIAALFQKPPVHQLLRTVRQDIRGDAFLAGLKVAELRLPVPQSVPQDRQGPPVPHHDRPRGRDHAGYGRLPDRSTGRSRPDRSLPADGRGDPWLRAMHRLRGVSEALHDHEATIPCIAVEPAESAVLSGGAFRRPPDRRGQRGLCRAALAACRRGRVDRLSTMEAMEMARRLATEEGTSTGAIWWRPAACCRSGATVVTVACDTGMKYSPPPLYGDRSPDRPRDRDGPFKDLSEARSNGLPGPGRSGQRRSMASAIPWPPPMHMVISARFPPVRSSA